MRTKSRTRSIIIWTAVELVIETRGQEHADHVVAALTAAGYDARVVR